MTTTEAVLILTAVSNVIFTVKALYCSNDKSLNFYLTLAILASSINSIIIGAFTAAFTSTAAAFRQSISSRIQQHPTHIRLLVALLFATVVLIAGVTTYSGWITVVLMVEGVAASFAVFMLQGTSLRFFFLFSCSTWLLVGANQAQWFLVLSSGLGLISLVLALIRDQRQNPTFTQSSPIV